MTIIWYNIYIYITYYIIIFYIIFCCINSGFPAVSPGWVRWLCRGPSLRVVGGTCGRRTRPVSLPTAWRRRVRNGNVDGAVEAAIVDWGGALGGIIWWQYHDIRDSKRIVFFNTPWCMAFTFYNIEYSISKCHKPWCYSWWYEYIYMAKPTLISPRGGNMW